MMAVRAVVGAGRHRRRGRKFDRLLGWHRRRGDPMASSWRQVPSAGDGVARHLDGFRPSSRVGAEGGGPQPKRGRPRAGESPSTTCPDQRVTIQAAVATRPRQWWTRHLGQQLVRNPPDDDDDTISSVGRCARGRVPACLSEGAHLPAQESATWQPRPGGTGAQDRATLPNGPAPG